MKYLLSITLALAVSALGIFILPQSANAANKSDFNPGYIIDDAVFYNSGAINATQIQNFLESKNPNCDYNGTQSAADWGYPSLTHAQLAEKLRTGKITISGVDGSKFHAPPYKCLTRYNQSTPQMEAASGYCNAINSATRTAAQIIKDVANACGINPQVLIVLLEKEQSLVTDKWPLNRQLQNATGFACPDTAPCDPAYGGFFYQVYYAARQFKVYKANPNSYNYRAGRNNNIYWHPDLTRCGSSTVYIQNQATAALYIYTPYRPNSAALNNLYGTGDSCSSYGNRNFWRIFTDWFGSTTIQVIGGIKTKHDAMGGNDGPLGRPTVNELCGLAKNGCVQSFENGMIFWTSATKGQAVVGAIRDLYRSISYERSVLGYPKSGEIATSSGAVYQQFEGGSIYWKSGIGAFVVRGGIGEKYTALGGPTGSLGYPKSKEACNLPGGGCAQTFENGKITWKSSVGAFQVANELYDKWNQVLSKNASYIGYPASDSKVTSEGIYQLFESGLIHQNNSNQIFAIGGGMYSSYKRVKSNIDNVGMPISNEVCTSTGCSQQFSKGETYWTSSTGGFTMWGGIRTKYLSVNAAAGHLGYPISDEIALQNGGAYRKFEHGRIYWKSGLNAFVIYGGIGNKYISVGAEKSSLGYPKSDEIKVGDTIHQEFEHGKIYWKSGTSAWIQL